MADVEAAIVHCPQCNAALRIEDADAATATCEYCGLTARIQRRTRVLQRKVPLPPPGADDPAAVARQVFKPNLRFWLATAPVLLIPLAFIAVAYLVASHSAQWMGGKPLLVDVDGDGIDDFIGLIRYVQTDKITLAAYSGASGHRLWETASLGTFDTVRRGLPQLAGTVIVRNDRLGITGYDVKTGTVRWHVRAADAVDRLCANTNGQLVIHAATGEWSTLELATGAMQAAAAPVTCSRMQTTDDRAIEADIVPAGALRVDGMSIQTVIAHGSGLRIALGWRSPGTGLTMIAAIDDANATRWRAVVSTDDRWVTALQLWSLAIDDRDVAMVYWHDQPIAPELAVFDRATGARRFDVALEKTKSTADGIGMTRTAIAVSQWGNLQIYDRETGHEKFTIP